MLRPSLWAALVALVATTVCAVDALAWCRATTCSKSEGTSCVPPTPEDCGTPLVWTRNCLGFAMQKDGSKQMSAAVARPYLRAAFSTWETADCGDGATPRVHVTDLGTVDCGNVEYNDKAGNVNVIVFRDHDWPHPSGTHNIDVLAQWIVAPDLCELFEWVDIRCRHEKRPLLRGLHVCPVRQLELLR